MQWEKKYNSVEIQEMSILSASCSFFSSKRCIIPGKQFLKKFHFIWKLFPAFLFSFFIKANDIFSSNFVILSAQLPELILVTLHHTECKSL